MNKKLAICSGGHYNLEHLEVTTHQHGTIITTSTTMDRSEEKSVSSPFF